MGPTRSRASASPKPRDTTPGMAVRREGDIPTLSKTNQNICSTDDTSPEDTPALKQRILTMASKVMKCEERNSFMGELMELRLGTKDVEGFIYKQESLRRGGEGGKGGTDQCTFERERELVSVAMKNKLADSLLEGVNKKKEFIKLTEIRKRQHSSGEQPGLSAWKL